MIFDTLDRLDRYRAVHPAFPEAFAQVKRFVAALPMPGRTTLNEAGLTAILSDYAPRPLEACCHEAHRCFIDIQLVLDGCEFIGCTPLEDAVGPTPYDVEGDITFFTRAPAGGVVMRPGVFAIFFPEDAHQPGVAHGGCTQVRKLVFKVPV